MARTRSDYRTKYNEREWTLEELFSKEAVLLKYCLMFLNPETHNSYMRENSHVRKLIEKRTKMSFYQAKETYFK